VDAAQHLVACINAEFYVFSSHFPSPLCLMRQPLGSLLAGNGLFDHAQDVALFHDQILDPLDLDLRARPFAEQHAVADLEIDGDDFPGLIAAAWTDGDHLSLRRLLFGGVRNDDPTCGLILGVNARNPDAVVKWPKLHVDPPKYLCLRSFLTK